MTYWEAGIYLNYYTFHPLSKLVKVWQKVDVSKYFAIERATFLKIKEGCKVFGIKIFFSWFIKKSAFIWNISHLTYYKKQRKDCKKRMFRKTFAMESTNEMKEGHKVSCQKIFTIFWLISRSVFMRNIAHLTYCKN